MDPPALTPAEVEILRYHGPVYWLYQRSRYADHHLGGERLNDALDSLVEKGLAFLLGGPAGNSHRFYDLTPEGRAVKRLLR